MFYGICRKNDQWQAWAVSNLLELGKLNACPVSPQCQLIGRGDMGGLLQVH